MNRYKQLGFLSIEAMIVLFAAMAGMTLGFQWLQADSDMKINRATAEHANTFTDATAQWMKDNYSTIQAAASPLAQYSATSLSSYLPASFSTTNPYGQSYSIRVYKAAANQLQAMVVTTGGETINELNIRKIAQLIGAKGGFVSSADTSTAQGAYGGWNMSFSNFGATPGAGKVATALFFQDGSLVSDYLYRNSVPGHPELNKMNTSVDMGSNNINNANSVNAATVAASGNVTAGGSVNAANANISGETYTGGWFRTQGDGGWYSQKWNGGWYMSDSSWVRSYADKNVYTGGQLQGGTVRSNGRLSTGEFAQIDGYAVEGGACPGGNIVAVDANTKLTLSCQSGVWVGNRLIIGNYIDKASVRSCNVTYTNTYGQLIHIEMTAGTNNAALYGYVNGIEVTRSSGNMGLTQDASVAFFVPPGASYSVFKDASGSCLVRHWFEITM